MNESEESALVDGMFAMPGHCAARELTAAAATSTDEQTFIESIRLEAEVITSCMVSLSKLPQLRREAVFQFIRGRIIVPQIIDLLHSITNETAPVISELRVANRDLRRQVAELRAELKALQKTADATERADG